VCTSILMGFNDPQKGEKYEDALTMDTQR